MPVVAEPSPEPRPLPRLLAALSVRRIGIAIALAVAVAAALNPIFQTPFAVLLGRMLLIAMLLLFVFTGAGFLPSRWLPRWVLQVVAVVLAAPVATYLAYLPSVEGDLFAVLAHEYRRSGFVWITGSVLVIAPVLALGALYRERDAQARNEALRFALERSRLEHQALDARLALLQAQIEPHFLFNTLANVQALVESGSPRAAPMLGALIAYLRAAMPRLGPPDETLGREAERVRAYLELMAMRMPDRLRFSVEVPRELAAWRFPPMALLTLVENAVRHGIDPAEQGGTIRVAAAPAAGGLLLEVEDSGVGLRDDAVPGTGLANLRERLAGFYGPQAALELAEQPPHGVRATVRVPAPAGAAAGG